MEICENKCCTKINNISYTAGTQEILKDVSLHIHCGTLTAIIGKNGSGKSTLLRAILGEIKHTGTIEFESAKYVHLAKNTRKAKRKIKIGYVPQKLNIENSPMTVYDMVASYCSKKPVFLYKSKSLYEEIREHLKEFGAEELIDSKVSRLSGGELQRIMMAIATMPYPDLLILDEPISGMDKNGKDNFYSRIKELTKHYDLAVLIVSHDFDYVAKYADNVVMLDKSIVAEGTPEEVFKSKSFIDTFGNYGSQIFAKGSDENV